MDNPIGYGIAFDKEKKMPLIICPSCGPETLNYSGRIIFRICDACK